jgi:hypothetical protein
MRPAVALLACLTLAARGSGNDEDDGKTAAPEGSSLT